VYHRLSPSRSPATNPTNFLSPAVHFTPENSKQTWKIMHTTGSEAADAVLSGNPQPNAAIPVEVNPLSESHRPTTVSRIMRDAGTSTLEFEPRPDFVQTTATATTTTAAAAAASDGIREPPAPKPVRPAMPRFTTSEENVLAQFFIGSIDQGTTSTRFIIFDGVGQPVVSHQHEFKQHYPESGWHEHDPQELVASVEVCVKKATARFIELGHDVSDIRAIGLTNQRETALVWDIETGEPLYNAIAWPDTRTKGLVRELKQKEEASGLKLAEVTGLPLSTYPSSVKLVWMLQHVPDVKAAYEAGRLAFGTVDSWLLFNLNGKDRAYFVTDTTNASRTMFMNLHTCKYDDALLDFFGLDQSKLHLPRIVPSSCAQAYGQMAGGPLQGMKIAGCLGDQSAALVGQQGFTPGSAKNTYGTGCFLLYNVGERPVISTHGLLATVAYDFGRHRKPVYALEGSIAVAGSGVKCEPLNPIHPFAMGS